MKQNGGRPTACSQNSWDLFAYQSWVEQAFLSPEEEHHRQAVCKLARALERIIQEELSPSQRQLLERCWLEGEKPAQVARETGLNRSTVSRTLRRAQEVINSRIQYAVLALEWEKAEPNSFQVVSQASQVLAAARHEGHTIGERIRRLRTRHALTKRQLAAALSCDEAAVSRWERDVELPDTVALMRIARLFSIRADDLLFGEEERADGEQREDVISPGRPCRYALPERNDPHPSA